MLKKYRYIKMYYLKTLLAVSALIVTAVFIILLLLPRPFYRNGFTTLADLNTYAKQVNENIPLDSENTIKPDFSSYYNTLKPTWKKNLKEKVHGLLTKISLAKEPLWSASFFKTQLETLVPLRIADGHKDEFICKLIPTTQSKFIVFGNLQGAFHSLVRDLNQLNTMGIISQDLKLTNPDYFMIFMGDVVDRSPITMETLSVLMLLLQQNPKNIIYLKGNHESNNYWQEHTLKTELQIRAQHLSNDVIPLTNEVNALFNTLPLACYITTINNRTNEFIRISDAGREQNELLIEQKFASFLLAKERGSHGCFNLKTGTPLPETDDSVEIKVILKGEKKRETFQPSNGLRLLPPDVGSTAWNPISCPTVVYQKALKFVHDAFVVITPAQQFGQWTITLHNRDITTKDSFKAKVFYLLSGAAKNAENGDATSKQPTVETKIPEQQTMDTTLTSTAAAIAQQAHNIAQQAQDIARKAEMLAKQKTSPTTAAQPRLPDTPPEQEIPPPPTPAPTTIPGTAFERVE